MIDSILNSEIFIVSASVISLLLFLFFIYKILKYFLLVVFLIGILFYFDILNKDNLTNFDNKYEISKTIIERYENLSFIKEDLNKIKN